MMRARQFALLVWPVLRAVPPGPMAAATVLALLGVLPAYLGAPAPASQIWGLRIAAVLLGAAASFAMIERMALLSVTATPRWLRQWTRAVLAILPAAFVWLVLYLPMNAPLPFTSIVPEALTCALAGVVGGAVAARHGHSATTGLAGPAAQGLLIAATLFAPARYSPWSLPATPGWAATREWWLAALVVLAGVLLAANREVRNPASR